jgi:uncharacterized heparinase superfamily protein
MSIKSQVEHAALVARTVRHLRPMQVVHRIRLRSQKAAMRRMPRLSESLLSGRGRPPHEGWPEGFRPLDAIQATAFPNPEANAQGLFEFVGEQHHIGNPPEWEPSAVSQLWRYHLHYFEWAWTFASHPDREWARRAFGQLWQSWRQGTVFGRWDAWSPYVVSLRAWALCGLYEPLVAGDPYEDEYVADLWRHANFIRTNLEFDVGGNHLIKNLKGLLATSAFFGDHDRERFVLRHLFQQVGRQVLPDGGHFERSPSYHCQVLGDLIDVRDLLRAAGRAPPAFLDDGIVRMQRWLGLMLLPDGDVPLFNDCTLVGQRRIDLLAPTPAPAQGMTVLPESGYVIIRPSPRVHVIADVGPPCPPELPAHAHADCLSFVLSLDGERLIVDTGTSTYEPGPIREYERSTSAHNTVQVDGVDQTEVWGTFRAGRRAKPHLIDATTDRLTFVVRASHDGFAHLFGRPVHSRMWQVTSGSLRITDEVSGSQPHTAVSRFHIAPRAECTPTSDPRTLRVGDMLLYFLGGALEITRPRRQGENGRPSGWAATTFGERQPISLVSQTITGQRVSRLEVTMSWGKDEWLQSSGSRNQCRRQKPYN